MGTPAVTPDMTQTFPAAGTVPFLDPSGTPRWIPADQVPQAIQAGGKQAVKITDPAGTPRWIPTDQQDAAIAAGGKLADPGDDETYVDGVRRRMTLASIGQRLSGLGAGLNQGFTSSMLGIEHGLRHIAAFPGLDAQIAKDSATVAAAPPPGEDPEKTGGRAIGNDLESLTEFMTGDAALTKAGKVINVSEHLSRMSKVAKLIEEYPGLAKVLGVGARQATVGGAQAAVHGGSASDVAESAAAAGLTGGVMEGIPVAADAFVSRRAPTIRTIDGVEIPVLRSQEPGASSAARSAATIGDQPAYQAQQQQGGQQVISNIAQRATQDVLSGINEGRTNQPQTDPARLLAAPADAQPYTFTLGPTDATEDVQNGSNQSQGVNYAGRQQVPNPNYQPEAPDNPAYRPGRRAELTREIGTAADALPDRLVTGEPGNRTQAELGDRASLFPRSIVTGEPTMTQSRWQVLPPETGGGSVTRGGGTALQSTDPQFVRATLSQLQDLSESPAFSNLSETQQGRINDHIDLLKGQLDDYDNNAYRAGMSHFAPVDVGNAVRNVSNFRDAATQIEAAAQPVYQKLDELTNGEWGALRSQQDAAWKVIRNPSTPAAYDAALERKAQIEGKMQQVFDDNRGQIAPEELRSANQAWRMASTARDLHSTLESTMNGVSPEIAASTGIDRSMKGGTPAYKRLSKLLADRGDDVKELIGQEGVDNLYRVSDLLKTPEKAQGMGKLLQNVSMVLRRHGVGVGAMVGAGLAHGAGAMFGHAIPGSYGLLAGAAAEAAYRRVVSEVATNPEIAKRVSYAVKNGVSNHISAPIIAMMMTGGVKQQQQQDAQQDAQRGPR